MHSFIPSHPAHLISILVFNFVSCKNILYNLIVIILLEKVLSSLLLMPLSVFAYRFSLLLLVGVAVVVCFSLFPFSWFLFAFLVCLLRLFFLRFFWEFSHFAWPLFHLFLPSVCLNLCLTFDSLNTYNFSLFVWMHMSGLGFCVFVGYLSAY